MITRGRSSLKSFYFSLLTLGGRDIKLLRSIQQSPRFPVLNLHDVSPVPNPYWEPLHPRLFERLIGKLIGSFRLANFSDLRVTDDPRPPLILSFDDGYHSFVEYVAPVLEKYGVSANLNVIPACIESGEPPWTVALSDFLNSAPEKLVRELKVPGFDLHLGDGSDQSKVRFGLGLSRYLKQRPRVERAELWEPIARSMERMNQLPFRRMLSIDEVRSCSDRYEIGAHSFDHESMGYESDSYFEADVSACEGYFNSVLGVPLRIYAFPNGSFRPSQVRRLKEKKVTALIVDERLAEFGSEPIPRLTIHGSDLPELWFRSLGWSPGT